MEKADRERIDHLCNQLLQSLDIEKLWPKLLENKIYNRDDVNISQWQKNLTSSETVSDICSTVKTRGPHAFKNFVVSLKQSGHQHIADELENYGTSSNSNNANNNVTSKEIEPIETSNNFNESAVNSNFDSADDYYTKIVKDLEPLVIKVKKAKVFKDEPNKDDEVEKYPMRSSPRGLVLIITNIVYEMFDNRPSAKHDEANLTKLFEEMGFKVIIHRNLTGKDIKAKVKEFSKMEELKRVDSAFIIISAHGDGVHGRQKTEIQGTDCKLPNYETVFCTDIIDYFTAQQCDYLKEKPKIFIFQTCSVYEKKIQRCSKVTTISYHSSNLSTISSNSTRGVEHQKAVCRVTTDSVATEYPETDKPLSLSTRNYDDTLIAYATLPGYVSYRDKYNGSWFIQILCEVFMNKACDIHVQDLFNITDRRIKNLRTAHNYCQTLWMINQGFTKHCYINPGLFRKPREPAK